VDQFREALAINPRYTEVHVNLALVLSDLGRLDEARACFEQAAEAEGRPRDGRLTRSARAQLANRHAELGEAYAAHGRPTEAIDQYRRALVLEPGYHDIRTRLGRAYLESGRPTLAVSEFGKVLAEKPDHLAALVGLGLAHLRNGDEPQARAVWTRCRELAPDDPAVRLYLQRCSAAEASAPMTGPLPQP
jgi:tetratricopeptide (TPR) repeat protein